MEVDEVGVRRTHGDVVAEQVAWGDLMSVSVITTSDGPAGEDVFFLLEGAGDSGVVVPQGQAPEGFVERLQQLEGFDSSAVIKAMGCATDARFHCWPPRSA